MKPATFIHDHLRTGPLNRIQREEKMLALGEQLDSLYSEEEETEADTKLLIAALEKELKRLKAKLNQKRSIK